MYKLRFFIVFILSTIFMIVYERDKTFGLDYNAFDQMPHSGWRKLAEEGC